jgi:hypothetical protein
MKNLLFIISGIFLYSYIIPNVEKIEAADEKNNADQKMPELVLQTGHRMTQLLRSLSHPAQQWIAR